MFDNIEEMYREGKLEECYDASRYNLSSGISRKGNHNFGTMRTDIIDRIQIRMLQIFGEDPFPSHTNQCLCQPIKGFVAVGVGPLNYDSKYVEQGGPHPNLAGDMKFLAERMKLTGPPLHVATKEEKRIFNEFLKSCPKPTTKSWEQLAALYKTKADYKTVFPKLPSMLRTHYTKWKLNQELVMVKDSISVGYYDVLKKLGTPSLETLTQNPAAAFQHQRSTESMEDAPVPEPTQDDIANFLAKAPENPLPIPPPGAPIQTEYICSDRRGKETRRCSAAPFGCPYLSMECSGRRAYRHCKLVQDGTLIILPQEESERDRIRHEYKKAQMRIRARERRLEKKRIDSIANPP